MYPVPGIPDLETDPTSAANSLRYQLGRAIYHWKADGLPGRRQMQRA
jgi:hypothetical protein